MRKRNIQKIVRFNRKEAQDLAAKAKKACLSEAGLIRLLIRGYEPKEKPDDRFYDVMRELSSIGNNINQIAKAVNTDIAGTGAFDKVKLLHLLISIDQQLRELRPDDR